MQISYFIDSENESVSVTNYSYGCYTVSHIFDAGSNTQLCLRESDNTPQNQLSNLYQRICDLPELTIQQELKCIIKAIHVTELDPSNPSEEYLDFMIRSQAIFDSQPIANWKLRSVNVSPQKIILAYSNQNSQIVHASLTLDPGPKAIIISSCPVNPMYYFRITRKATGFSVEIKEKITPKSHRFISAGIIDIEQIDEYHSAIIEHYDYMEHNVDDKDLVRIIRPHSDREDKLHAYVYYGYTNKLKS